MGAFNEWTRGSFLAEPAERRVALVACNLLAGAAALTRVATLRTQGVEPPPALRTFGPRTDAELESLMGLAGPKQPAPTGRRNR